MSLEEVEREMTESVSTRTLLLRKSCGGSPCSVEAMTRKLRRAIETKCKSGVDKWRRELQQLRHEETQQHRVRIFQFESWIGEGSVDYDLCLRDLLRLHADVQTWQRFVGSRMGGPDLTR